MTDNTITGERAGMPSPTSRFAFVRHLDPLRCVQGTRGRYDCPDLASVDRHLAVLRRRIDAGARSPDTAAGCRTDIDLLLERRAWLTLPMTA